MGLRLSLFLPNFPGATFIQGAALILDSRVDVFKFNYEFKRILAPLWSTQLSVGNHRVETSKNVENKLKIEITQTFNHLPFR